MTELQELVKGVWTMQAEAEARMTNSNLKQLQDQQTLLRYQVDIMRRQIVANERMSALLAGLDKLRILMSSSSSLSFFSAV